MKKRLTPSEKKGLVKLDKLGKNYVCPQCGPDSNGLYVHSKTHHTFPPYTVEEAKAEEKKIFKEKP